MSVFHACTPIPELSVSAALGGSLCGCRCTSWFLLALAGLLWGRVSLGLRVPRALMIGPRRSRSTSMSSRIATSLFALRLSLVGRRIRGAVSGVTASNRTSTALSVRSAGVSTRELESIPRRLLPFSVFLLDVYQYSPCVMGVRRSFPHVCLGHYFLLALW